jgi:hypothetical protein
MTIVTVPGAGEGSTIGESFDNANNLALAQQIANALAAASSTGSLHVTTASSTSVPPPPSNPGGINELIINAGGSYTIPGGSPPDSPNWVVISDSKAPVTINGSPNITVWGGLNTEKITDPAAIVLSETAGDTAVTVSGAGDVLAGNNHNDTLTASGNAASVAGGTGTNVFFALGSNDTVSAQGNSDTLFGGSGGSTFLIAPAATNERVVGSSGALTVSDAGVGSTIFGGSGALNVATAGSLASVIGGSGAVSASDTGKSNTIIGGSGALGATLAGSGAYVAGGLGALSVTDNGTSDTIAASLGFASVTAATSSSVVESGAGLLNFVGGTGSSTVFGFGSGDASVFGGTGTTHLVGGSVTYVNTTSGGMVFYGESGNEKLDASLSKGPSTIYGGLDPTGNRVLIGGQGSNIFTGGEGAETLVGGSTDNSFFFWKGAGGSTTHDVLTNWSPATDFVLLGNYGAGAADAAIAGATTAAGSTTLTLSDNTKITFIGVTNPATLTGHIFST